MQRLRHLEQESHGKSHRADDKRPSTARFHESQYSRVAASLYTERIALTYHRLLSYVFRRFSVLRAPRTAVPTLWHYALRKPLPASDKPALFTMNILPPMMTVWHHCVRKYLKDEVDTVIFDCSGALDPRQFPGARVQKFLNFYAATKSDEFLYKVARNRRIGWICDDDVFPIGHGMPEILQRELAVPKTATVSFKPRTWWHYEIDGQRHEPSGSYCLGINREIVIEQEHLSLAPCEGNTHPTHTGKGERRYDTFDYANEVLLHKGYRCAIVPEDEREASVAAFSGMSGAVMLLWYYRTPEQTMRYFTDPPEEAWQGNMLWGVLSSMLAICSIQECYREITGHTYPLRSLPTRADLEALRRSREPLLKSGQTFQWIDDISAKLKAAI